MVSVYARVVSVCEYAVRYTLYVCISEACLWKKEQTLTTQPKQSTELKLNQENNNQQAINKNLLHDWFWFFHRVPYQL